MTELENNELTKDEKNILLYAINYFIKGYANIK
jgi:hypothetical protein